MNYINEAFKRLNDDSILNEESFSMTKDGIEDLEKFRDGDNLDIITVIDPEAANEDELQDSYVGKVILQCEVCNSMIYKNPEDVIIDETSEIVNSDEECPYCANIEGYKVIGQVAPFSNEEPVEETEESDEEETEITVDDKEVEEESTNNSFDESKSINENFADITALADDCGKNTFKVSNRDIRFTFENEDDKIKFVNELLSSNIPHNELTFGVISINKSAVLNESKSIREETLSNKGSYNFVSLKDIFFVGAPEKISKDLIDTNTEYVCVDIAGNKWTIEDSPRGEHGWITIENIENGKRVSDTFLYDDNSYDMVSQFNELVYDYYKLARTPDEFNARYGRFDESKSIKESTDEKFIIKLDNMNGSGTSFISKNAPTNPDDELFNDADSWFTRNKQHAMIFDSYSDAKNFWNEYIIGIPLLADSGNRNDTWSMKDCIVKYNESESIKESIENLSLDTDDTHMEMTSEENGKVTITTEPKSSNDSTESIAPLEPEVEAEFETETSEDEQIEEPEDSEDDEINFEVDEIVEESFNYLSENYLKKVYGNVQSYKTIGAKSNGNKLILEGVIKFKSGKEKHTSFIFEAKTATKKGKVRFLGENAQITKGRKAFSLLGSIEDGKLLTESLTYNYRTKDQKGSSNKIYGTIKNK